MVLAVTFNYRGHTCFEKIRLCRVVVGVDHSGVFGLAWNLALSALP